MSDFFIELININILFPWLTFGRVVVVLLVILIVILLVKLTKGTSTITLWGLKIQNNKEIEKLQKQFEDLNKNNNLKTHYLKLLNQSVLTTMESNELPQNELVNRLKNFYDFYLHGITTILTNGDNVHRIAIFYKHEENELKILHGHGYSPEGKEKLSLNLHNSKAGYSFIHQKIFHSGDLTQDSSYARNPKSSKHYYSLLCIPVIYRDETVGVLSVDGLNANSFVKDDIDYLTYMANGISRIIYIELNELQQTKEGILS